MSTKQEFINEIKELKKGNYIHTLTGDALDEYKKCMTQSNWEKVSPISHSLLAYLYDLIEHDFDKGCSMINTFKDGYPGHKYTAIFPCWWDVISTQRIALHAFDNFDIDSLGDEAKDILQSLMINAYMRWISIVYETYRKFLVFDLFCLRETLGKNWKTLDFLYKSSPAAELKRHSQTQSKPLTDAFEGATRHAVSHGNAFILQNESKIHEIVIQETNEAKTAFTRKEYKSIVELHNSEIDTTYILFESMRISMFIYSYLVAKFADVIKQRTGVYEYTDTVTMRIYANVKSGKMY